MTEITEISTHRPGNSTLTDGDVVAIRTQYQAMRREAESSVDKWCDLTTTDQALATQYGVNPATITNLVLGRSRISAGGPVDTDRRVEMETYQADVKAYGRPEANVRRRFRQLPDRQAAPVTIRLDYPDGTAHVLTLPAGTKVATLSVPDVDSTYMTQGATPAAIREA